ncbi:MMPL family transporter [Kribbella sp. NBC_00359]|uniref:MMPL family transporter n=1 Tax=Kribbella sp. NBC_00359 TaxID=2975966 RepID=UPI002E2288E7
MLLLAVAGIASAPLPHLLSAGGWTVEGSDSARAAELVADGFVGRGRSSITVVVHDQRYAAAQPEFSRRVSAVLREVASNRELETLSEVGYATSDPVMRSRYVGRDQRTAMQILGLGLDEDSARRVLPDVQKEFTHRYDVRGLEVSLVGTGPFWGEVNALSERGLAHAELLALPLILLVLVLVFRGVVAALVSVAVGVAAIVTTLALLAIVASRVELSLFVQNTATMLGLGVGIDYSMFVIARFKEELARGRSVDQALAATLRTSGGSVLFSGATIVAAMATLFLVPLNVISSIALGAMLVVAFAVLSSLLLLPVLLRILGPKIAMGRLRRPQRRTQPRGGDHRGAPPNRWQQVTETVMRRPVLFLGVGAAALLLMGMPAHGLATFTPDAQILPASSAVRQGYDRMRSQFGAGSTAPLTVVVTSEAPLLEGAGYAAVSRLIGEIESIDGVERVDSALPLLDGLAPGHVGAADDVLARLPEGARAAVGHYLSDDGRRVALDVMTNSSASDPATRRLLDDVRAAVLTTHDPDVQVFVGGETAEGVDSNAVIQNRMPWVAAVMLVVMYVLLMLTFRSLLLPLKAIMMNLLSVTATFGILVVVFQHGVGAGQLGLEGSTKVQNFVPVLLLTLLFSLSTDYEVFLLSRVREHYRSTGDNEASVAAGMSATAPLISGAALLMVVVFGAFAMVGMLPIKQLGFGMAFAILIDATVVRLILVPASMRLLGRLNWWMPRPFSVRPANHPLSTAHPDV